MIASIGIFSTVAASIPVITGDVDVDAFIYYAAITDSTQQTALYTFVTSIKSTGEWAKCLAIYPFVGGTENAHKRNLKNPLDANTSYRIAFTGSPTHNAAGVTFDGSTQYANTFLTFPNINSTHFSAYTPSDSPDKVLIGKVHQTNNRNPVTSYAQIVPRVSSNNSTSYSIFSTTSTSTAASTSLTSAGSWLVSRTASNAIALYRAGTSISTGTTATQSVPLTYVHIGVQALRSLSNVESYALYWNGIVSFATIGTGLTSTEAGNLHTAIQVFQTTLGRQV